MKKISDDIIRKIYENSGIYDTRIYRYTYSDYPDRRVFKRIKREYLGTTASYTEWEELGVVYGGFDHD